MKDFIFSLNATMPVFLLMALGFIFNKIGAIDENFANKLNNLYLKFHCQFYFLEIYQFQILSKFGMGNLYYFVF